MPSSTSYIDVFLCLATSLHRQLLQSVDGFLGRQTEIRKCGIVHKFRGKDPSHVHLSPVDLFFTVIVVFGPMMMRCAISKVFGDPDFFPTVGVFFPFRMEMVKNMGFSDNFLTVCPSSGFLSLASHRRIPLLASAKSLHLSQFPGPSQKDNKNSLSSSVSHVSTTTRSDR